MKVKNKLTSAIIAGIMILAFGASAQACLIVTTGTDSGYSSGRDYKEEFHKSYPLSSGGEFSLTNVNGEVSVTTWSKNEVDVYAIKTAKKNKDDLRLVKIVVDAAGDSVRIDTEFAKRRNLRVKVDYEIKVPEGVSLNLVRSTNGSVKLNGEFDDVKASTTNGDVKMEGKCNSAALTTTNGSIRALDVRGPIKAQTTNGQIHLTARDVRDEIGARSTNGSITLRVVGDLNADVELGTTNGSLNLDIPVTVKRMQSRRRLTGTIGSGGPLLSLHTTNGSITIER